MKKHIIKVWGKLSKSQKCELLSFAFKLLDLNNSEIKARPLNDFSEMKTF